MAHEDGWDLALEVIARMREPEPPQSPFGGLLIGPGGSFMNNTAGDVRIAVVRESQRPQFIPNLKQQQKFSQSLYEAAGTIRSQSRVVR